MNSLQKIGGRVLTRLDAEVFFRQTTSNYKSRGMMSAGLVTDKLNDQGSCKTRLDYDVTKEATLGRTKDLGV